MGTHFVNQHEVLMYYFQVSLNEKISYGFLSVVFTGHTSTGPSTREGKILILALVLMLASRPFSWSNKHSYACAGVCDCACVASENQS